MLNIVATPIGNLDDLSLRQAKVLATSDVILAEDTRSAQTLLEAIKRRFNMSPFSPEVWSYYKEKEFQKLPEIVDLLREGKNVSLISDAGTPLVSDPGFLLVKICVERDIPMTVIPGPSAITTALVYSGFNPQQHMFLGFLPKKEGQMTQLIKKLRSVKEIFPDMVFVVYESPLRVVETLTNIIKTGWEPEIVVCREMTKKFEEIIRAPIKELISRSYKGEITIVIK